MQKFDTIRAYVHEVSAITLDPSKDYLITARFDPLVKELGCAGIDDIVRLAHSDSSGGIRTKVIDAITTNETYFFRDPTIFDLFKFNFRQSCL